MLIRSAFVATLIFCSSLVGQSVAVFPSDHTNVANGSTNSPNWPLANGVSRVQMIYEAWDLQIPNGAMITRIGFRPDAGANQTGHGLQLEVLMGPTTKTAADASGTFANNYTSGMPATVFPTSLYQLPNLSGTPMVWIDLANPHVFDNTQNLLVEYRVFANSNGNQRFTYRLDRGTFISPVTQGAGGCQHSGGQTPDIRMNRTEVGGNMSISLSRAPASSVVLLFLSVNTPLQTPYPLTPFINGIQSSCQGQIGLNGVLFLTDMTNTSGSKSWNIRIPNDRVSWNDATVATQALAFDFFSPGGAVVSDAEMVEIGIDPAETLIGATGNAMASSGGVARNYGIITFFQHQ